MTEQEALNLLRAYAERAGIRFATGVQVRALRRELARHYQPRQVDDDDAPMRQINPAVDRLRSLRFIPDLDRLARLRPDDRRSGSPTATPHPSADGAEGLTPALRDRLDDLRRRAARFGQPAAYEGWAWTGATLHGPLSAEANEFALPDLGQVILDWHGQSAPAAPVQASLARPAAGAGDQRALRLLRLKIGRGFEDVSRYRFSIDGSPRSQRFATVLGGWLRIIAAQVECDRHV